MAKGGKRPGAGRKKGSKLRATLERETLRAYFDKEAVKWFAPILEQYLRRATGEPSEADPRIQIDFLNRTLGKPAESVEVSGKGGAPVIRMVIHEQDKG